MSNPPQCRTSKDWYFYSNLFSQMCRWWIGSRFKRERSIHEAETSYDLGTPSRASR